MELDLLKQNEDVTIYRKCDIPRTDHSKITEKRLNKTTISDAHTNHLNEAGRITALQKPNSQMKEKRKTTLQ